MAGRLIPTGACQDIMADVEMFYTKGVSRGFYMLNRLLDLNRYARQAAGERKGGLDLISRLQQPGLYALSHTPKTDLDPPF